MIGIATPCARFSALEKTTFRDVLGEDFEDLWEAFATPLRSMRCANLAKLENVGYNRSEVALEMI
jgi:hypothetical protein